MALVAPSFGQTNFIVNGGFETDNPSAPNPARIEHAQGWNDDFRWIASGPNFGTADHYYPGPGSTTFYTADPHTGSKHAGIAVETGISSNLHYREFIEVTSLSLTAGQDYWVEFWVKRANGSKPLNIGAYLTTSNPSILVDQSVGLVTPQVSSILTTGWQRIGGAFTPAMTGNYNMIIGHYTTTSGGTAGHYIFVDDVAIFECTPSVIPSADFNLISGNAYCLGDPIIAADNGSIDFQDYRWICTDDMGTVIGQSPWNSSGTITDLNVVNFVSSFGFTTLEEGKCYDITLEVRDQCETDSHTLNFCIEDPNVDFIFDGLPVCEGLPFTLEVTGDNGWQYDWSTGDSGIGIKTITPVADETVTSYTVTVTTGAGCTSTQTINVIVHDNTPTPPSVGGINGTSDYVTFVNEGNTLSFLIPSSDVSGEATTMGIGSAIPGGSSLGFSGTPFESGTFTWNVPIGATGYHSFDVFATDNNSCAINSHSETFIIKVICEDCPETIYYENRTPASSPLPALTIAGASIVAGTSVDPAQVDGPVDVGTNSVEFRAPRIDLMPGFTGSPPYFSAIRDIGTCTDDCETFCCDQFSGFSYDTPFFNVITPNGDGVNDFWYLSDVNNPFCAFGGATKFRIEVHDPGVPKIVYVKEIDPTGCCPFEAPAPSNPIAHSSIFWDGTDNTPLGGGAIAQAGSYEVLIRIWSPCGDVIDLSNIQVFSFGPGKSSSGGDGIVGSDRFTEYVENQIDLDLPIVPLIGATKKVEIFGEGKTVQLFPNPATDQINIITSFDVRNVEVYALTGGLLKSEALNSTRTIIAISDLSPGMYLVRVYDQTGNFTTHSIVKE